MHFHIESEQEEDGRWIAEIPEIPGALAYGRDAEEAMAMVEVLAEQIEVGETRPMAISVSTSLRHEPMAFGQGQKTPFRLAEHRPEYQASNGFPSDSVASRSGGLCLRVS
jgi:predicted RNase H-like HicB family nuclease